MLMLKPKDVTDANFVSSTVPDNVSVANVYATGSITVDSVTAHAYATGSITVDSVAAAVAATGAFTVSGLPVTNETFVVDGHTFTFKTTRSAAFEVAKGSLYTDTATNMRSAINDDLSTVNASGSGGNVALTADTAGTAGNSIGISESATNITASGANLSGGSNSVPYAGDTFVVGTQTFTFKASGTATGDVVINTSSTSNQAANIKTSIDRDISGTVTSSRDTNVVTLTAVATGTNGNSVTLTESAGGVSVSGSGTLSGGSNPVPAIDSTFAVGGQTFTFKLSGTSMGDVVLNASSTTTQADNIRTSITRDMAALVTASGSNNVTTLTAVIPGTDGNAIVLTESAGGVSVSGSGTLSGGVDEVIGYDEYAAGTTYADGAQVVVTSSHTVYESLQNANTGHTPASSPTYWTSLGMTNRWKMFDTYVTSQTTYPEEIEVVLEVGSFDSLAVLYANATSVQVVLDDSVEGDVYDETQVNSSPTTPKNFIFTNIPGASYPSAQLIVTITNTGSNATCGFLIPADSLTLGITLYGADLGIIDYSIKEQDDWGNWIITERKYAKRATFPVAVETANRDVVRNTLDQYRATPAVYVGNDGATLQASGYCTVLTMYGWAVNDPMELGIVIDHLMLEIEGLI